MTPDLWRGIERRHSGFRAVVSQGRDRPLIRKSFPPGTDPRDMQRWRQDQRAAVRVKRKQRATRGTFAGDAARYLASVTAMPTYKERQRQIQGWVTVFGTRQRDAIDAADIRAQRDVWLTEPRGKDAAGKPLPPLGPHTVNLRLRALSNLYTVLDGRRAENPVRDVDEAPEPESVPRDLDYPTIRRILAAVPDRGRADKGGKRPVRSMTKIRLAILAYTGLPAAQLARLTRDDVDLERGLLNVPSRRKGTGSAASILPLVPPAVDAFRELAAADAFGEFSRSSMWKSFAIAAKKADVTGASPYALRHSFATVIYDLTGDDHLVMTLLQHAALKTSLKYRQRAMARVLQRKVAAVGKHFGITGVGGSKRMLGFRGVAGKPDAATPTLGKTRKRQK